MILCISLPFQAISFIQGKSFSTPYCPTNGRLNYAKQFGDCSKIRWESLIITFFTVLLGLCRDQGSNFGASVCYHKDTLGNRVSHG